MRDRAASNCLPIVCAGFGVKPLPESCLVC
jgi:hypothetical protein